MGSDLRALLALAARVAWLVAAAALLAFALRAPGRAALAVIAAAAVVGGVASLWQASRRADRMLARFVEALDHGDLARGFSGGRFDRVGAALDAAMRNLRAERARAGDEARLQAALADEAPAALLLIDGDGRVTLANKAARNLFRQHRGTRIEDFAIYGAELAGALAGSTRADALVPLRIDGIVQRATVRRATLRQAGLARAIATVQPIQRELSAVELAAQADLVRVLTHEIMNSMTPIVSLAESAAKLMALADTGADRDIADAHAAVATLARRAGGIVHFVESYRAFSRAPAVAPERIALVPWTEELARLFRASPQGAGAALALAIEPPDLVLNADPDLLAQVVLNLLKNGAEAAAEVPGGPRLRLAAGLLPGGRTRLTVSDNGPGLDPALADEVFLPFFTTKPGGTGVGLSLARRILVAHGGTIALAREGELGGATFELVL